MATNTKVGFIDGGKTSQEGLSRWIGKYVDQSGVFGASDMKIVAAGTPDTTVKISVGDCMIANLNPNASSFFYSAWVTSQDSVTISANASGNPRVDAIVAYIDLAAVSSATSDNPGLMKFMDVNGTPAGSPVAPSNSTIQSAVGAGNPWILLATIAVANGFSTISNGNITDQRVRANLSSNGLGWKGILDTWTYSSATSPSYVITIPSDGTTFYQPGMRVRLTQSTVKYFIVTAVSATTLTVYGGINYTLTNAAISNISVSNAKVPFGFPYDPTGWTIQVGTAGNNAQASPVAGTWYNLGTTAEQITLPPGLWDVQYNVVAGGTNSGGAQSIIQTTLSTANNSESDNTFSTGSYLSVASAEHFTSHFCRGIISVSSATTYYLNTKTTGSITNIENRGDVAPTVLRAICAYL